MWFVYDLLSACIVVMSTTGLLTARIKGWQYIALTIYSVNNICDSYGRIK